MGSVRVIVDGNGVVKERNDYYPFGARHARSDYSQLASNRFKYNGKEEQVTGDLGYLDYGSRMYDSGLGRWFSIDPVVGIYYSETPYCYTLNSPVNLVDPNGAWVVVPTRGQLFVMSEQGDDYNSLMTFFGSESSALYYLFQDLLDLVKKGDASFYLLVFNATNNLSVAWADVFKNPRKYGSRKDEEDFQNTRTELKMSKDRYDALKQVVNDPNNGHYNCYVAAIKGALHEDFINDDPIYTSVRDEILKTRFVNVTPKEAVFGRTVISFGNEHDVLFLGKSRDGIINVFTKNGPYFAPKIMELKTLIRERPYGYPRDHMINNRTTIKGTGYYNPKNMK